MKRCSEGVFPGTFVTALLVGLTLTARSAVFYVDVNSTNPQPPYASWATAATVIQTAIDAASSGDTVLVNDGTYATGGRALSWTMTNRVGLYKALTVQSVNGPAVTTIQGAWDPTTTNGVLAIRGAWLTNGATLSGFTIQGGATSRTLDSSGGGVCCYSSSAKVVNCVIQSNSAANSGGGVYQGTFTNCLLRGNNAPSGGGAYQANLFNCSISSNSATSGGGTSYGTCKNCSLVGNSAGSAGGAYLGVFNNCSLVNNTSSGTAGGIYGGTLTNCTVTGNSASNGGGTYYSGTLRNCIVYFNWPDNNNISGSFSYSCTTPAAPGVGNLSSNPQLLPDGIHLASTSPCRGTGASPASGTDIDGQPWATPPSMGCDEWQPAVLAVVPPLFQFDSQTLALNLWIPVAGQAPFTCWWTKDGTLVEEGAHYSLASTTNLVVNQPGPGDAGVYQVVVSNAFGVVTSQVTRLVFHCVDAAGSAPMPPYANWASAATNIQDAIDAAQPGDIVLVTNGVYAAGGKVMAGDLTNRVVLTKALTVQSVNGPGATVIQGAQDPATTNGPAAIRCAWLTNGAVLSGFTLRGGATRNTGDSTTLLSGGGVWCSSTNAMVAGCRLEGNAASGGGGAYAGMLNDCTLTGNVAASSGGGAYQGILNRCTLTGNAATSSGGGAYSCVLNNCTVLSNTAPSGGGAYSGTLNYCTIKNNQASAGGGAYTAILNYCEVAANSASGSGGGAYGGSLSNCKVHDNSAVSNGGGLCMGTYGSTSARNCWIAYNQAGGSGGGVYNGATANLNNCTVVGNSAVLSGGGVVGCSLLNCIVYYNLPSDSVGGSMQYSCSSSLQSGAGNITSPPALLADALHLSSASPCIGTGTSSAAGGTDLDGQPWSTPPAMGCDEWRAEPILSSQPGAQCTSGGSQVGVGVLVAGQGPFTCWWFKDGQAVEEGLHYSAAHTTCLGIQDFSPADVGAYQVIVSNAFGMVTSQVVQVTARYVDLAGPGPLSPYLDWASAATNIQDAINASSDGDVVFVTNGVYATGGKVEAGNLTNRVALDKAILVQSLNGPDATVIQGAWDAATNGPAAVRCAWLGQGATLSGFTLRGGATRSTGDKAALQSGGGVWGLYGNASAYNCLVVTNAAASAGAGAYRVTLNHCSLLGNVATGTGGGGGAANCTLGNCVITGNSTGGSGGGATNCVLTTCAVIGNLSSHSGGGVASSSLTNCTLSKNFAGSSSSTHDYGGGAYQSTLVNSIAYRNYVYSTGNGSNYASCTFTRSCAGPLPAGTGNISADPQLLSDGLHLAATSPCRGLDANGGPGGTDLDGQAWASPASIGCDEWQPVPLFAVQPQAQAAAGVAQIHFGAVQAAGQEPFSYFWSKDGKPLEDSGKYSATHGTDLLIKGFDAADAGIYRVVVSNAAGMVTSQVAQVVVHCVDAAGANPVPPYTSWQTASTNIQPAIDVAAAGDFVLVTNGLYATGGRMVGGAPTNRVAVDKAVALMSVNGSAQTIIQGAFDPVTTNGPAAVRCVWMASGAALNGFTLQGGATTATNSSSGGGVCAVSITAVVANCLIRSNSAAYGGGAYGGVLNNCILLGNRANYGGGAGGSLLNNCLVQGNWAALQGGGIYYGNLNNCTVVGNSTPGVAGGVYYYPTYWYATITNSIIYFNSATADPDLPSTLLAYNSCTPILLGGAGNLTADPQLVDGLHLAATSPCRGAGMPGTSVGTDIDGDLWANPPAIGCDEVDESVLTGPLTVTLGAPQTQVLVNRTLLFTGAVTGRAARLAWSFGDGVSLTNGSYLASHAFTNAGDFTITLTAYNATHAGGVTATTLLHVLPLSTPQLQAAAMTANGFSFQFAAQAGATNVLEMATNLNPPIVWQPLQTLVSTGGVLQVTDPTPTNALRFYRIRTQ